MLVWDPIKQRKKERKRREALLLSWYRMPIAHPSLLCACLRNRRFCNVLLFTNSLIQLFVAERKRAFRTAWCRCLRVQRNTHNTWRLKEKKVERMKKKRIKSEIRKNRLVEMEIILFHCSPCCVCVCACCVLCISRQGLGFGDGLSETVRALSSKNGETSKKQQ